MTLCNMSIEAGARAAWSHRRVTFEFLRGRAKAPQGAAFDQAVQRWSQLATDAGASFDRELRIDASAIRPTVTWGTNPGQVVAIDRAIPLQHDDLAARALDYMGFRAGAPLLGEKVDVVFIGSCTNGRLTDLREAAGILRGRHVAAHVRMLVVPGSDAVKRAAEAEGLHSVFLGAGAEWREPGCSMCIAMNGDIVAAGQLSVSTSNRNFEGRQGPGARTCWPVPATAAACAMQAIADPLAFAPLRAGGPHSQFRPLASTLAGCRPERRHRPDHSRAIPQPPATRRARRHCFAGCATTARAASAKLRLQSPRFRARGYPACRTQFGCGSSREHARWRCSISASGVYRTRIADIFRNNA